VFQIFLFATEPRRDASIFYPSSFIGKLLARRLMLGTQYLCSGAVFTGRERYLGHLRSRPWTRVSKMAPVFTAVLVSSVSQVLTRAMFTDTARAHG